MALEAEQIPLLRSSQEGFFSRLVGSRAGLGPRLGDDADADVHPAAHALVRDHVVGVRVCVKRVVQELGLLVRDFFLAGDFLGAKPGD